jgi:hypothetical protein
MELSLVMSIGNNNYGSVIRREVEPAVPTSSKKRAEYSLYTVKEAFKDIDHELVIVEWCGKEEGEGPSAWDFVKQSGARIIRVPYEFTRAVSPERAFHEGHAKNIGVRRAKGEMILTLNQDCLWLNRFPRYMLLEKDKVTVANRPTVYHNVLDCNLDMGELIEFCHAPQNIVHTHDWNANGDFTMMHRDIWFKLQGLSTPLGTEMAGVDMWQVQRAEILTAHERRFYPYNIWHIRHPGSPLGSSFGKTIVSDNWGFPGEKFEETT